MIAQEGLAGRVQLAGAIPHEKAREFLVRHTAAKHVSRRVHHDMLCTTMHVVTAVSSLVEMHYSRRCLGVPYAIAMHCRALDDNNTVLCCMLASHRVLFHYCGWCLFVSVTNAPPAAASISWETQVWQAGTSAERAYPFLSAMFANALDQHPLSAPARLITHMRLIPVTRSVS